MNNAPVQLDELSRIRPPPIRLSNHDIGATQPVNPEIVEPPKMAVRVSKVCKHFKRAGEKVVVMNNLSLEIARGSIFALLGPSGCGKTTLLRVILGQIGIDSGQVETLGQPPGTHGHIIPGLGVGYQPQENGLILEFTISQTLFFHGRMANMSTPLIKERIAELVSLLDLPNPDSRIEVLSGGQKRRVSMAASLLAKPPLLILDEPTVGVDPVLRKSIWAMLRRMVTEQACTVLVTTHYIDEAGNADAMAVMRGGHFLAKGTAKDLREKYDTPHLEDIFLILAERHEATGFAEDGTIIRSNTHSKPHSKTLLHKKDSIPVNFDENAALNVADEQPDIDKSNNNAEPNNHNSKHPSLDTENEEAELTIITQPPPKKSCWSKFTGLFESSGMHLIMLKALFLKNLQLFVARKPALFFNIILPAIQITVFMLCIGPDPKGLEIAICNQDVPYTPSLTESELIQFLPDRLPDDTNALLKGVYTPEGAAKMLLPAGPKLLDSGIFCQVNCSFGAEFVDVLTNDPAYEDVFKTVFYDDLASCRQAVVDAHAIFCVHFPPNFTEGVINRAFNQLLPNSNRPTPSLDYLYDASNYQISSMSALKLFQITKDAVDRLVNTTTISNILNEETVYGEADWNYTTFMMPAILISMSYNLAMGLTALSFVREKMDGIIERCTVAGASTFDIMVSYILSQSLIGFVQTVILFVVAVAIFQAPCVGSIVLTFLLVFAMSLVGMTFGFTFSAIGDNEQTVILLCVGSIFPLMMLCGVIWPLEAMPLFLQYFAYTLPLTFPGDSLRFVMLRGWGLSSIRVWYGFFVSVAWIVVLFIATILVTRMKHG